MVKEILGDEYQERKRVNLDLGRRAKKPGRMFLFLLVWRLVEWDLEEQSYVSVDFLGSQG